MMCLRFFFVFGLWVILAACQGTSTHRPPPASYTAAPDHYLVLAQKAITYQADFQLDDWAKLLAENVEYHRLSDGPDPGSLRGKTAVLAYWNHCKDTSRIREVHLSAFSLLPVQTLTKLPLADLSGVYVAAVFRRRVVYRSGQTDERPVSLWLHFNDDKLIDRFYSFQDDRPPT